MAFTIEQRVFIIKYYAYLFYCAFYNEPRNYSENVNVSNVIKKCQIEFENKFKCSAPSIPTIKEYVKKFDEFGSVEDTVYKKPKTVLTEAKLETVKQFMSENPEKSLAKVSAELDMSKTSAHRALHKIGLFPYKIQVMHQIKDIDFGVRIDYCKNLISEFQNQFSRAFFSDEAWFHLSGFVNKQNTRKWLFEKDPNFIIECPLKSQKIGVWCALSQERIIGPIFLTNA